MGGFSNIFAQIGAYHTYFLCSLQNFICASFLYAVQNFICYSDSVFYTPFKILYAVEIIYMLFKILCAVQNFYMLFRYFICCSKFLCAVQIFYMLIEMQIYFHKLLYVTQHEVPDTHLASFVIIKGGL